jgi:pimeloyl-ACP methyl ester carboxylesterase
MPLNPSHSPILLLHGALGSKAQMKPLEGPLLGLAFDFPGHGGQIMPEKLSMERLAESVLEFMQTNGIAKADFLGYSMGGFVALYLAQQFPDSVNKLFCLGTKIFWDTQSAAKEIAKLNPKKIKEKVPKFAQELENIHGQNWEVLLHKTSDMLENLAKNSPLEFTKIKQPVFLGVGDGDTTAGLEDTVRAYRELENSSLWVIPQTKHPLESVETQALINHAIRFFGKIN